MAYSVNWLTKVVSIPDTDLTPVSAGHYRLDMNSFRGEIRRLEWTEGLFAEQILEHVNQKLNFAGANYAGFDQVINGYTVQFTGSLSRVDLVGSNNNLIDVLVPTGVSVVPANSAGLQVIAVGSGVTTQDKSDIAAASSAAVIAAMVANPPPVDAQKINGHEVIGDGSVSDPWRGVGVPP
jgi:hypothetical protein